MKNTEQALAQQLIVACETLLKNANRSDAALVQSALGLAKAHYASDAERKDA